MKLTPCTYEFARYEAGGFQIDALVTGHYDMVLLFAEAVKRLQLTGQNYRDGTLLSRAMRNTSYNGLQTGTVRINENGDAQLSYEISSVAAGAFEFSVISQ